MTAERPAPLEDLPGEHRTRARQSDIDKACVRWSGPRVRCGDGYRAEAARENVARVVGPDGGETFVAFTSADLGAALDEARRHLWARR